MKPLSILIAYLIGAIPFAYLVVRSTKGIDIRSVGSGNVGSTNALRAAGKGWGVFVLLLDCSKGYAAVALARILTHDEDWALAAAVMVILGHMYPVFLRFHGGKGVAAGFGAYLAIAPLAAALSAALFVLIIIACRYVSLGSILASASFPLLAFLLGESWSLMLVGVACAMLVIWKHAGNIQRLLQGTENRLKLGKDGS